MTHCIITLRKWSLAVRILFFLSCLLCFIWEIHKPKLALHISLVPLISFICVHVYQFSWNGAKCSCAHRKHLRLIVFLFFCSFKFLWCFCLIIHCPFYSDMQDGRVREKNMSGCKSCLHVSEEEWRMKHGARLLTPLCHVELDHKTLKFSFILLTAHQCNDMKRWNIERLSSLLILSPLKYKLMSKTKLPLWAQLTFTRNRTVSYTIKT